MKTLKTHLRIIAVFFSALIFFQGCTVYKSANVTLDEAVRADTKVRIKTNNNSSQKFLKVMLENDSYYGFVHNKGERVKTLINEDNIETIQVKDKTLSIVLSIALPVVIIGGIVVLVVDEQLGN